MSKRGLDASLAEQMDRLKKSMHSRDQRRDKDREKRLVSKAADDPYAQSNHSRLSTGGVNLGAGAAAQAAVLNAAALAGPDVIRCELCQTDFRNEAMLRQHEEGPAHKKALARQKAEREREAWATNPSAAANALQAAAWLNGGVAAKREPNYVPAARSGRGSEASKAQPPKPAADAPAKPQGPSHAQLIAQARRAGEPISINGWVPPSLSIRSKQEALPEAREGPENHLQAGAQEEGREASSTSSGSDALQQEQEAAADSRGPADQQPVVPQASALPGLLAAYSSASDDDDDHEGTGSDTDQNESKPKFESFF